ncbi:SusC/RagA family TonB-linked outer membrane protein [Flagellimonas baculiformis]|uniref:SusC/RagA family TonB-linked outer membrane protein n=1 Tax=Flagellimonas baculiformis TaxID=3067310 RepID=UPI00296F17F4|nr:SusC/RagA family TonB-linked outer membrane protein [Muricauda sp. D6]
MRTKLNGLLTLLLAFVVHISFAQDKTITGTVTDANGLPLPGVNIVVEGTTSGTQTDFDGNYAITARQGQTLLFTYLGLKATSRTVGSSDVINVQMEEDAQALDEVVVTGVAGATSVKKLSVTVAKVSADELQNVPAASAANALQGKVSGVTVTNLGRPGQGANIILRGAKNLFGSQSPLVIVDGVFVEGGLADINVDDIESFEIVKGASASSLYGSRAGNGVIVVTSKKGKAGRTQVTIRSEVGFSELGTKMDINKSHHYALASDFADYEGLFTKYAGVAYPDGYQGVRVPQVVGARIQEDDLYSDNPYGVYYDFQDEFFRKGINQTLYTSVSSGSENAQTFFSYEHTENEGILIETEGYARNSFRLNTDFKINDWLKLSASNLFVKTKDYVPTGDNGIYRSATRVSPDANVYANNPDGQPYYYYPDQWSSEVTNPLYYLSTYNRLARQQRFLGGYNLNIKLADWINLDSEYSFEKRDYRYTTYRPYETYTSSGDALGFGYSKGSLTKYSSYGLSQKAQFTANIAQTWGDLNLKSKLSFLMEDRYFEDYSASGYDFLYKDLPTLDNFDTSTISSSSDSQTERAKNFFAIVGLDYKDRYIIDGMFRYDGSSLFGINEKWAPYYRVSGAYRISEDFPINGINELKIHASYGTSGQRPGFDWQYEQTEITNGSLSTDRLKGNPDLKPSRTSEFEAGINIDFLDNRFRLEANYSKSETEDQFMKVDLFSPANAGKNKQWQNVGTVSFDTYEATLQIDAIKNETTNWTLGFNFATTKNEIEELAVASMKVGPDDLFYITENEEFGSMYGRSFVTSLQQMEAQLDDGQNISDYAVNADGIVVLASTIGTADEAGIIKLNEDGSVAYEKIGNQNADFQLGITSNFTYKNFGFYMLWDWKQGGDVYNRNYQWNTIDLRSSLVDQAGKPASEKKTTTYYASLYDVNQNNAFWVEDGTFVKLREVSLSYTLDKKILSSVASGFFDSIRFSLIGRNLLTITDYKGWDPEVAQYDSETLQYYSVDYGVYPVQRAYSLSLQFKF